MEDKLLLALALSEMSFLTFREKGILEKELDSLTDLAALSFDDISHLIGRVTKPKAWTNQGLEKRIQQTARIMELFEIRVILHGGPEYPPFLGELFDPPYLLFVRGDAAILCAPCVSVVGTRNPSPEGAEAAFKFAEDAATDGFTVVSGLAFGIDACAHKGALAGQGKTAAILAGGVDGPSPRSNRRLAGAILGHGGCLASEYLPGTPPEKWRFPQRNRIIAGLSEAVVVVDAPGKSGALITAEFALSEGREVFVHRAALGHQMPEAHTGNGKKVGRSLLSDYVEAGAPVIDSYEEFKEKDTWERQEKKPRENLLW
jgi:DNA processing protein